MFGKDSTSSVFGKLSRLTSNTALVKRSEYGLKVSFYLPKINKKTTTTIPQICSILKIFPLLTNTQYHAQQHLAANDPILRQLIAQVPLPDLQSTQNVFHDLMSCLIEQQIHYRSTKRIFHKMLEAAGIKLLTTGNFALFERKGFVHIKLSAQKYETIGRALDFFTQENPDWERMDEETVRSTLSQIKGVGPWTIDMILLYTLQHPDVFPADDYHLKQLMVQLYRLDPTSRLKRRMQAVADAWAPHRSAGVRYLLAWKEFQKN